MINTLKYNIGADLYIYIDGGRSLEGTLLSIHNDLAILQMKTGHTIIYLKNIIAVTVK
jgi:hypothetical protein